MTLIRTQPWMAGPYAAAVEASTTAMDEQREVGDDFSGHHEFGRHHSG